MARELKNANITHVSYVDKAANQTRFFLTKAAGKPTFEKQVKLVTKADDAQKLVYGIVYEPGVTDAHNDFMTTAEIEKAAHGFMANLAKAKGDVVDTQHDFDPGVGEVVESYVAPADFTVGEQAILKGSWVMVTKASDEIWDKIQKGEITGYSMAGTAETVADVEVTKMGHKFLDLLKGLIAGNGTAAVQKGEVMDAFNADKKTREFWDALYIFEDIFYSEVWKDSTMDVQRISNAATDFGALLTQIAAQPEVLKALNKVDKTTIKKARGEDEVNPEQMKELLKEAVAPVMDRLEKLEKAAEPAPAETPAAVTPATETPAAAEATSTEELVKQLKEVLKAEMAPVMERLTKVETARGIAKATSTDEAPATEVKKADVWAGLL